MLTRVRLAYAVLLGVLLTPSASFCTSYLFPDPAANVVWTGKKAVVAYDAKGEVRVQAYDTTNGRVCWSRRLPGAALVLVRDICHQHGLVCVATENQGIYVLNSDTGALKARLRPRNPRWEGRLMVCTKDRVLLVYHSEKPMEWKEWLVAYSTQTFRSVWEQPFIGSSIFRIAASSNQLTALVVTPSSLQQWQQVVFRCDNGQVIARRRAAEPYYVFPDYLPKAVRRWCSKTVGTVGHTSFERGGRIWFVGKPLGSYGQVYAVRDDGHVVWTKPIKGLSSVALARDRLIAAVVHYDWGPNDVWPGWAELLALDAATGKQLWAVKLHGLPTDPKGHAPAKETR